MAWTWPPGPEEVREWMGGASASTSDPGLAAAVDAAVSFVPGIPSLRDNATLWTTDDPPVFAPTADVIFGTVMLAARLHARKGSVLGVSAGYSDLGASEILRWDPDIARLLRLGSASDGFVFGAPTPVTASVVTP